MKMPLSTKPPINTITVHQFASQPRKNKVPTNTRGLKTVFSKLLKQPSRMFVVPVRPSQGDTDLCCCGVCDGCAISPQQHRGRTVECACTMRSSGVLDRPARRNSRCSFIASTRSLAKLLPASYSAEHPGCAAHNRQCITALSIGTWLSRAAILAWVNTGIVGGVLGNPTVPHCRIDLV